MSNINESKEAVAEIFSVIMPFNRVLGLTRESFDIETGNIRFSMKDNLVGNTNFRTLHGGVISAIMDTAAGFLLALELVATLKDTSRRKAFDRLKKLGTIDLRVDYLQPGTGSEFVASSRILRIGNKVAVIRTELRNDMQKLLAVGTATFLVG